MGTIQRKTLDRDLISARTWLDRVNSRLAVLDADAKTKIKNIFHVNADGATDAGRLMLLRVLCGSFTNAHTLFSKFIMRECGGAGVWILPRPPMMTTDSLTIRQWRTRIATAGCQSLFNRLPFSARRGNNCYTSQEVMRDYVKF
jgi:hypothetical protein